MTPVQVLISFFIAVLVTVIFAVFLRSTGPWKGFWIFFFIIFFVTLAASEYVTPVGPTAMGYPWIPGILVAVIFAVLLAAVTPKRNLSKEDKNTQGDTPHIHKTYNSPPNAAPQDRIYQGDEPVKGVALSGFLWVLFFLLTVLVIFGALFN